MFAAVHAVQSSVAAGIDGYVDDETYPSGLDQRFTPAWIDAILAQRGLAAPRQPRGPFTYVDLGCGDGVGLILLATAHPEARFIGIDALADHVARGRALAATIGLANVSFQCATFEEAGEGADAIAAGTADYVALRGVVTWVSAAAAGAALDLATHLLRARGALAIGYNVLPAWSALIPFQRLVFDRAAALPGTGAARFEAALAQLRADGLVAQSVLDWLDTKRATLPAGYFPHEYLNRHWAPIWSGDLIAATAGRGLHFAGNADPGRQRPEFLLRAAQRQALAAMDVGAREIATDTYLNCCFRTDFFLKADLQASETAAAPPPDRLRQVWTGHARADTAAYAFTSAMGRIAFDNPAARAILRHLETGPDTLDAINLRAADLLNTLDALWLAGLVAPAEPPAIVPLAERTNQIVAAATAAAPIGLAVTAHGIVAMQAADRS